MANIIKPTESKNTPAIVTVAGTVIASNPNRIGWQIQNVGSGTVFIRLGGTASSTVFHTVLKAGSGDSDGTGGSMSQLSGVVFTGDISMAGTTPKILVLEHTG